MVHNGKPKKRRLRAGFLVAIEGIDGSGKTTQAKLLEDLLRIEGYDAARFKEPTDGPWGRKIKAIAHSQRRDLTPAAIDREVELFIRDRQHDVSRNIRPALRRKAIVVMDRYYHSSIAYQGMLATIGLDEVRRRNERIAVRPSIVFLLDVPPVISMSRIGRCGVNGTRRGSTTFEDEENLERVREAFLKLHDPIIHTIDGTLPRGAILDSIFNVVSDIASSMERP